VTAGGIVLEFDRGTAVVESGYATELTKAGEVGHDVHSLTAASQAHKQVSVVWGAVWVCYGYANVDGA